MTNREIKFRVWCGYEKAMLSDIPLLNAMSCSVSGSAAKPHALGDQRVLMQFTGLQDRNEKDIYEGDLVNFRHDTWTVQWRQNSAGFSLDQPNHPGYLLEDHLMLTVIGNVFENPELLSEAK